MKSLTAISCAFIMALTATAAAPQQVDRPPALEDGWTTASPRSAGLDEAPLTRLATDIRSGDLRKITSVLMVYNEELVYEAYFDESGRDALRDRVGQVR